MLKNIVAYVALISLLSCTGKHVSTERLPQSSNCGINYEDIGPENLAQLIRDPQCNIKSVDDVLKTLPDEAFVWPTLVHRSDSLQGPHKTDYLNPRVILKIDQHDSRKIYLTYNGKPSQPGYNSLEIAVANAKAKTASEVIKYFDITFPERDLAKSWEEIQSNISISKANPVACARCHGAPIARPIFPAYPKWDGIYHAKQFGSEFEKGQLQAFIKKHEDSPDSRYSRIQVAKDQFAGGGTSAVTNDELGELNGIRLALKVKDSVNYKEFKYAYYGALLNCDNFSSFIPPQILSRLLNNLDAQFNLRERWPKRKYMATFERAMLEDPNIKTGFGPEGQLDSTVALSRGFDNTTEIYTAENLKRGIIRQSGDNEDILRLAADTLSKQDDFSRMYLGMPLNLRLITEGRGIEMNDWGLDLLQPTYRMHAGIGTVARVTLFEKLAQWDNSDHPITSELKLQSKKFSEQEPPKKLCESLKTKSIASLKGANQIFYGTLRYDPTVVSLTAYPITFLVTCAKCHSYPGQNPTPIEKRFPVDIPFNSPAKMHQWMQNAYNAKNLKDRVFSKTENLRMPPQRILSDREKQNIQNFINKY